MSIASKLELLQQDITNARTAITAKGGTVTSGGGSSQLATDIATIPSGGTATVIPLSIKDEIDIDLSQHQLCQGILGDGTNRSDRVIETGSTLPAGYFHYNIEFKFRKSSYPTVADENFIGMSGNSYNRLRIGFARTGNIFCRGWNRTNLNSGTISLDEDHVVKVTYSSNTMKLYVDDVLQGSSSISESTLSGKLIIGTFYSSTDTTVITSTFNGILYYVKMTDPTDNDKVIVNWDKTIVDENNKPVVFVNGDNGTLIQTLEWAAYNPTGTYADGFNPVKVSGMYKWGATIEDMCNGSVPATPTLHDVVIPAGEANRSLQKLFRYSTIKSFTASTPFEASSYYPYYYAVANNPYLESVNILLGTSWSNTSSGWGYFANECTGLKHVSINGLVGSTSNAFGYMFYGCTSLEDVIWYFNPNQPYFGYSNQFNNAFRNCLDLKKITFSGLERSNGNAANVFNYCFRNCITSYDQDINHFRFPDLEYIGITTGTSNYSNFKYAFSVDTTYSEYYGKCSLIFPEMYAIYNRNATVANGHFAYCDALGKIYLPKFTIDGTTGKNIFNNCTYLTEIHFGIENQATVEALAGYTDKFGATNATIYFDMPNHITVNGVVYDREDKGKYDYDTSHYSWVNGTLVIYTTNAINPAVGDEVYTKSGTTYTSVGTITAIA